MSHIGCGNISEERRLGCGMIVRSWRAGGIWERPVSPRISLFPDFVPVCGLSVTLNGYANSVCPGKKMEAARRSRDDFQF